MRYYRLLLICNQWTPRRLWADSAAALAVLQALVTCRIWTSRNHRCSPTATVTRRRCRLICRSFRSGITEWWTWRSPAVSWPHCNAEATTCSASPCPASDHTQPTAAHLRRGSQHFTAVASPAIGHWAPPCNKSWRRHWLKKPKMHIIHLHLLASRCNDNSKYSNIIQKPVFRLFHVRRLWYVLVDARNLYFVLIHSNN